MTGVTALAVVSSVVFFDRAWDTGLAAFCAIATATKAMAIKSNCPDDTMRKDFDISAVGAFQSSVI
jgi:hypothetical protein